MKIVVCIKQIIDPQTPAGEFRIDPVVKRAILPKGRKLVISDYDEVAVEAALRIKEAHGGEVTVISMGEESARDSLRHCLAMGADQGILLNDASFDDSDSYATAKALSLAIKKNGDYDLVLCGNQEGDWDAGQVGSGMAYFLGIPGVTMAGNLEINDRKATIERMLPEGSDRIEVPLPALVTVGSEIAKPRYPPFRSVLAAGKKEIPVWSAGDIGYSAKSRNRMLNLYIPAHEDKCYFIEGDTPEDIGTKLAERLKEANLF